MSLRPHDQLGTVATMQFRHRPVDVCLCGLWTDHHALGDLVVAQARGDELDDLLFAAGQHVACGRRAGGAGQATNSLMSERVTAGASSASPRGPSMPWLG
jgi:hypothetical protein